MATPHQLHVTCKLGCRHRGRTVRAKIVQEDSALFWRSVPQRCAMAWLKPPEVMSKMIEMFIANGRHTFSRRPERAFRTSSASNFPRGRRFVTRALTRRGRQTHGIKAIPQMFVDGDMDGSQNRTPVG
jgi:hypothetical protein